MQKSMMSSIKTTTLLGALFASSAYAHIAMTNPIPFGKPSTSPLQPSGGDYPCQSGTVNGFAVSTMNQWPVGSQQKLEFTGTAVHGGGSCQVAVSLDKQPTRDSKWKVIKSFEGGCPGVDGATSTFNFDVIKELPNGEMTMAWTWFNHIGNREMYMNCAPVTVTGGSDDKAAFEGLPDMALANIAVGEGANCKTSEGSDYSFANAGKYVERIGSGPFKELCGGASTPGNGSPANPGAPPAQSAPNNGQYTPPASQQVPASSGTPPQATGAPSAQPTAAPGPVTSTLRTLVTVTATGQPPSAPTQAPNNQAPAAPQPSQGTPQTGACTTDGGIVCNGDSQFGICNQGKVVWQAVAPGTKCQNGAIAKRDYTHRVNRRARRSIV